MRASNKQVAKTLQGTGLSEYFLTVLKILLNFIRMPYYNF